MNQDHHRGPDPDRILVASSPGPHGTTPDGASWQDEQDAAVTDRG
jgi:hypothetical protein